MCTRVHPPDAGDRRPRNTAEPEGARAEVLPFKVTVESFVTAAGARVLLQQNHTGTGTGGCGGGGGGGSGVGSRDGGGGDDGPEDERWPEGRRHGWGGTTEAGPKRKSVVAG